MFFRATHTRSTERTTNSTYGTSCLLQPWLARACEGHFGIARSVPPWVVPFSRCALWSQGRLALSRPQQLDARLCGVLTLRQWLRVRMTSFSPPSATHLLCTLSERTRCYPASLEVMFDGGLWLFCIGQRPRLGVPGLLGGHAQTTTSHILVVVKNGMRLHSGLCVVRLLPTSHSGLACYLVGVWSSLAINRLRNSVEESLNLSIPADKLLYSHP